MTQETESNDFELHVARDSRGYVSLSIKLPPGGFGGVVGAFENAVRALSSDSEFRELFESMWGDTSASASRAEGPPTDRPPPFSEI